MLHDSGEKATRMNTSTHGGFDMTLILLLYGTSHTALNASCRTLLHGTPRQLGAVEPGAR